MSGSIPGEGRATGCFLDEALNALGCGYVLRGDPYKALEVFRKAALLNERNRFAGLNIAFTHTLCRFDSTALKDALAEVARKLIRFPHEGRLHIHQGELMEAAGLLDEAEQRYLRRCGPSRIAWRLMICWGVCARRPASPSA